MSEFFRDQATFCRNCHAVDPGEVQTGEFCRDAAGFACLALHGSSAVAVGSGLTYRAETPGIRVKHLKIGETTRMVDDRNGRRFAVPASRRLTWDLLYFHRAVPLCSHDRRMMLKDLGAARDAASLRISWPAVFLKAMALVGQDYPELRQIWYRWPWAHLYQHPGSVAVLTIQREIAGQPWLFWGRIANPEARSLPEIQTLITRYQTEAPSRIFSRDLRLAGLPLLLRRLIWWWNLNVETVSRAKRIGTFFLSTLAGRGVEIQLPPSVQTTCLTYGPLDESGISRVTLAYDHRIMDGARVAEILTRLEEVLLTEIRDELQGLAKAGERTAA